MVSEDVVIAAEYTDVAVREAELADPRRMEKIAGHLSAGGTLIDYCKLVGQSFVEVKRWIDADEKRAAAYEAAKKARQEWLFERVLEEYKALSTFSLDQIYNEDGGLKPVSDWPQSAKAAVSSVESVEQFEVVDGEKVVTGEVKKVRMWDKTKTLQDIGKHLKMFAEVIDVNVNQQISIVGALEEAERRVLAARVVSSAGSDAAPYAGHGTDDQAIDESIIRENIDESPL